MTCLFCTRRLSSERRPCTENSLDLVPVHAPDGVCSGRQVAHLGCMGGGGGRDGIFHSAIWTSKSSVLEGFKLEIIGVFKSVINLNVLCG